ncbi:hypothetical protein SeLEV6574_g07331 [Synchytrium endobioticum]|uniref:RING-type domain-containing protein n=1 Tax=Synchytrium endobioticum TaxID=286115 RepID=A0A507CLT2_9FUNG|nr:hypothetical protein SeLEV6574_g07331 [Synchytrium endobioticum]
MARGRTLYCWRRTALVCLALSSLPRLCVSGLGFNTLEPRGVKSSKEIKSNTPHSTPHLAFMNLGIYDYNERELDTLHSTLPYTCIRFLTPPPIQQQNPSSFASHFNGMLLRLSILSCVIVAACNMPHASHAAVSNGGSAISIDITPPTLSHANGLLPFHGYHTGAIAASFGSRLPYITLYSPSLVATSDACAPFSLTFPTLTDSASTTIVSGNDNQSAIPWTLLIPRGNCPFDVKCHNAAMAGASVCVIYNDNATVLAKNGGDGYIVMMPSDSHLPVPIPAMHLRNADMLGLSLVTSQNADIHPPILAFSNLSVRIDSPLGDTAPRVDLDPQCAHAILAAVAAVVVLAGILVYLREHRQQSSDPESAERDHAHDVVESSKLTSITFPKRSMTSADVDTLESQGCQAIGLTCDTCAICLDGFNAVGLTIRTLPCLHNFHMDCIDPWLLQHNRLCPCCKQDCLKQDVTRLPPLEGI